jgi:hypothetical protein
MRWEEQRVSSAFERDRLQRVFDTSRRTPPDFGCHWSYPTSARRAAAVPHWSGTTSGTPIKPNGFSASRFRQIVVVISEQSQYFSGSADDIK